MRLPAKVMKEGRKKEGKEVRDTETFGPKWQGCWSVLLGQSTGARPRLSKAWGQGREEEGLELLLGVLAVGGGLDAGNKPGLSFWVVIGILLAFF